AERILDGRRPRVPAGCARRQMTFHSPMDGAGLELAPLPTLICSELKDQRLTSGPNCWLRRGTEAYIPGRCSPQRRRVVVWGVFRLCDLQRSNQDQLRLRETDLRS